MIINGSKVLTTCEFCKNGFNPSVDYADRVEKDPDDIIISWCRKCDDKNQ